MSGDCFETCEGHESDPRNPLTIAPPRGTPSLWFTVDDRAYRLDDPGQIVRMGPRHRELCLALIRYSTDGRDEPTP